MEEGDMRLVKFMMGVFLFFSLLLVVFLLFAPPPTAGQTKPDLNQINYHDWNREPLDDHSSFGTVGTVYLVQNVRPEYEPQPGKEVEYRKEDLVKLTGSIFTNPKGNFEVVVVIYDADQKTPLFAVYAEELSRLDNFDFKVFYRAEGKWKNMPTDKMGQNAGWFWSIYQQTGKLLYYP